MFVEGGKMNRKERERKERKRRNKRKKERGRRKEREKKRERGKSTSFFLKSLVFRWDQEVKSI